MKWISISGYDISENSSGWGNYLNSHFNFSGLYSINYGKSYSYADNKQKTQYNIILSSGSTDRNMAKNIYDMAGNLWEWTAELNTDYNYAHSVRGGFYDYSSPTQSASSSVGIRYSYDASQIGYRVVLYMK